MKNRLVFVFLVLVFGFVFSGCATTGAPADKAPGVPKTISITGFDQQIEETSRFYVELTGDWLEEQNTWIIPAAANAQRNGQTLTAQMWHDVGGNNFEPWTDTGEYGVNIHIFPGADKGRVQTYRYRYNMPGGDTVTIKDAETTIEWSDFVFAWDWDWEN